MSNVLFSYMFSPHIGAVFLKMLSYAVKASRGVNNMLKILYSPVYYRNLNNQVSCNDSSGVAELSKNISGEVQSPEGIFVIRMFYP